MTLTKTNSILLILIVFFFGSTSLMTIFFLSTSYTLDVTTNMEWSVPHEKIGISKINLTPNTLEEGETTTLSITIENNHNSTKEFLLDIKNENDLDEEFFKHSLHKIGGVVTKFGEGTMTDEITSVKTIGSEIREVILVSLYDVESAEHIETKEILIHGVYDE